MWFASKRPEIRKATLTWSSASRKLVLVATAITGMLLVVPSTVPAQAQQSQWCSKFKGMVNFRYSTEDQCRASRSGRGGTCFPRQASR
ncbi:DUF3551 domain-containing protein [Bradyrhizobium sp. 149]|uniref:DUF3551 domain-containing protein n=1 Tax=Bradyrhizobium sp. 149 TaxID=2782624 RepID=UPI00320A51B3